MKKFLVIATVATLALSMVACGPKKDVETTNNTNPTDTIVVSTVGEPNSGNTEGTVEITSDTNSEIKISENEVISDTTSDTEITTIKDEAVTAKDETVTAKDETATVKNTASSTIKE